MRSGIYFDEKQLRRRRRILKLKIYGVLIGFLLLIAGIGYLIIYSSLFQIKNITLTNADSKQIDADIIIRDLKIFFASQSKIAQFLGPNNILIWGNKNLDEFLKSNLRLAELVIEKDYLDRQIRINVREREKFGIWCPSPLEHCNADALDNAMCSKGEGCMWFDKNGIIFAAAPMVEGNLIYKISDFSGRSLKPGESILDERFLSNLFKIFKVLNDSDLKIKQLVLKNLQFQEITTDLSTTLLPKIYFSLRIDPGFSLSALESFKNLGLEKIEYVDLRVENRAYYKLK